MAASDVVKKALAKRLGMALPERLRPIYAIWSSVANTAQGQDCLILPGPAAAPKGMIVKVEDATGADYHYLDQIHDMDGQVQVWLTKPLKRAYVNATVTIAGGQPAVQTAPGELILEHSFNDDGGRDHAGVPLDAFLAQFGAQFPVSVAFGMKPAVFDKLLLADKNQDGTDKGWSRFFQQWKDEGSIL